MAAKDAVKGTIEEIKFFTVHENSTIEFKNYKSKPNPALSAFSYFDNSNL